MIKRECGDCDLCCKILEIKDEELGFYKPACETCKFLKNGCSVFGKPEKPKVCTEFE